MEKTYWAVVEADGERYSIAFPDVKGCYSEADSEAEIYNNAKDALSGQVKFMVEDGESIPEASTRAELAGNLAENEFLVPVVITIPGKTVRINITTTGEKIDEITAYARKHGLSRSEFMVNAAMREIRYNG